MALYVGRVVPYDLGPMRSSASPLAALAAALVLAPTLVDAKPKDAAGGTARPACGVTWLPLVEGNTWSYQATAAPLPATPDIARVAPLFPKGFVITVKSVVTQGPDTVVTLEEKVTYDMTKDTKKPLIEERLVTSTITCNAKKFDISPESFFFNAEPGGFTGLSIDKIEHKAAGTTFPFKGGQWADTWRDDVIITWTRKATEGSFATFGSGTLELERQYTAQDPETITIKAGVYKAEKIGVQTSGRVTLTPSLTADLKPMELPGDWVNQLWFVDGVGVVQGLNHYAHMYQLVESTLK